MIHSQLVLAASFKNDEICEQHYFRLARENISSTSEKFDAFIIFTLLIERLSYSPLQMLTLYF